jgi:predicted flap endonuclease-1-like 5' DNA nuclease/predicted nuclease with TOPRIM domain
MPEITVIHIAIVAGTLIVGVVLGWIVRGSRSIGEKAAINESWQEQLESQRGEHQRLLDQNKSLMDQNSQYQASNKDAKMRASELSDALKEAFERRDELQRQLKDIRSNLETAVAERNELRDSASANDFTAQLEQRDARIEKLNVELKNWQDRLPPLIERYQQRNAEAEELESRLAEAQERITALEDMLGSEQTRVEPVDQDALTDGMDASNDPNDNDTSMSETVDALDDDGDAELLEADAIIEDQGEVRDSSPRDDLKLIKGVGPAIEKTLNELGISRFDQIAQMSEYDIDRVANRLKGFRSRIYREDWIGQARNLHDQKVSNQ